MKKKIFVVNYGGCGCGCDSGAHSLDIFAVNFVASSVRRTKYEGRETLVVPIVLLRETVVNGAFVPVDELDPRGWNGVPVTVGHPKDGFGDHVSANSPDVLTRYHVGKIFGAHVEGDKLKGEAWIDVERAEKVAPGLIASLEAGERMDVSTGYFPTEEKSSGSFHGKRYHTIHSNIVPDHLALLPGEEGACSWDDGCGVRANEGGEMRLNASDRAVLNESDRAVLNEVKRLLKDLRPADGFLALSTDDELAEMEVPDVGDLIRANRGVPAPEFAEMEVPDVGDLIRARRAKERGAS